MKKIKDIKRRMAARKDRLKKISVSKHPVKKIIKEVPKPTKKEEKPAVAMSHHKTIEKIAEKHEETTERETIKEVKKKEIKMARRRLFAHKKERKKFKLITHLDKAGIDTNPKKVRRIMFYISVLVNIALTIVHLCYLKEASITQLAFVLIATWTILFIFIHIITWLVFLVYMDLRMLQRRLEVESVLPEFLQLTASNMKAGMTIDHALWEAVRPQFGVLAKEVEVVAKQTYSGEDLVQALRNFSAKYDSKNLERSVNLIIEGIEAGGNISELLNKVAQNLQDIRMMRKELAANVMTYIIFIIFAAIIIAPFMFALSFTLVGVVQNIVSGVDVGSVATGSFRVYKDTFSLTDFKIYAYAYMLVTSVFSSMIISGIRKGNFKEGIAYMPVFTLISYGIYFLASNFLAQLMANII